MKRFNKTAVRTAVAFIAFSVLLQLGGNAQTVPNKNQVKVSLLRFFNPGTPGAEISYERSIIDRVSLQASYTYILPFKYNVKQFGYRFSLEPKYFFFNKSVVRQYVSARYEYHWSQFQHGDYFIPHDYAWGQEYYDHYAGNRTLHFMTLQWGMQVHVKDFMFEVSGGIGVKNRSVIQLNRQDKTHVYAFRRHFSANRAITKPGTFNSLALPMSFKIGYSF